MRGVLHAMLQRRSQVLSTATVVERPPESFWGLSRRGAKSPLLPRRSKVIRLAG